MPVTVTDSQVVLGRWFLEAGGSGHRRKMETGKKYPAAGADADADAGESNTGEAICTGLGVAHSLTARRDGQGWAVDDVVG